MNTPSDIFSFDAFLFDMDGVIVDSDPTHKIAFKQHLAQYGIDCTDEYFLKNISGNNNFEVAEMVLGKGKTKAEYKQFGDAKEALFRTLYRDVITPLPGVILFLQQLKKLGKKTAICTSAPIENLEFITNALNIGQYFNILLCEDDVTNFKPHPQVYNLAMERLGVNPTQSVVFEDSSRGTQAGLAANCSVVVVNNSQLQNPAFYTSVKNFDAFL
jgi:beta-phosphoglucomutase